MKVVKKIAHKKKPIQDGVGARFRFACSRMIDNVYHSVLTSDKIQDRDKNKYLFALVSTIKKDSYNE